MVSDTSLLRLESVTSGVVICSATVASAADDVAEVDVFIDNVFVAHLGNECAIRMADSAATGRFLDRYSFRIPYHFWDGATHTLMIILAKFTQTRDSAGDERSDPADYDMVERAFTLFIPEEAKGSIPDALLEVFDAAWYLERYPDVAEAGYDPLYHYLRYGGNEGRDPSPYFDGDWYLSVNADKIPEGSNPLVHFIVTGAAEGRDPSSNFSMKAYIDSQPDLADSGLNPLVHFIRRSTGRLPLPGAPVSLDIDPDDTVSPADIELVANSGFFDLEFYLKNNPDVASSSRNPIKHYLTIGAYQGRDPGPEFSSSFYLNAYKTVADVGMNPLIHFLRHGAEDGLMTKSVADVAEDTSALQIDDSSPADKELQADRNLLLQSDYFDSAYYLKRYSDVGESGLDPIEHYLRHGAAEGRDPSAAFSTRRYLKMYKSVADAGMNPLVHYLRHGVEVGLSVPKVDAGAVDERQAAQIVRRHYNQQQALPVFHITSTQRRVTMVTDSINAGSLFGGVGTAIIFTILLAKILDCRVRFVLRTEPPTRGNIIKLLKLHNIEWDGKVEFVHLDVADPKRRLDVSPSDIFVTTSWWTTQSTRLSIDPRRIIYLLQEDERMFYPMGDDHLRCDEVISDKDIFKVINTDLLLKHFARSGVVNQRESVVSFEPSFPSSIYYAAAKVAAEPMSLFFYARPNNARNLFMRGIEVLDMAILQGVLDPTLWEINLAGKDIPDLHFSGGVIPKVHVNLGWDEYAQMLRNTDLGLSLMYTPHPSYPPLDLAASGAVAVTNRFPGKESLQSYCSNIIVVEPDVSSLVEGLRVGIELATNRKRRTENYLTSGLNRDWQISMKQALAATAERFHHVYQ